MAKKESALSIGKRLKISKAQQNMLGAVLAASMILGVCLVLAIYLIKYINFNVKVVEEKEKAVQGYSDLIKELGVCSSPSGRVYSGAELSRCAPNSVSLTEVKGTFRQRILEEMAQNTDLESVGRDTVESCYDNESGEGSERKKYSYEYWNLLIENTEDNDELREYYTKMLGMCSALRVIPDALPAFSNDLALMASLDKVFEESGWKPESLSPGDITTTDIEGVGAIEINLMVEANGDITQKVLANIEKSIRDFEINSATITWNGSQLNLSARATAYYTERQGLVEETETVKGDLKTTTTEDVEEEEE